MTFSNKNYGRLSAQALRDLLQFLPILDIEHADMTKIIVEKQAELFTEKTPKLSWCHLYELPYPQHAAIVNNSYGIDQDVIRIANSENPTQELINGRLDAAIENSLGAELDPEEKQTYLPSILALNSSIVFTLRSLITYGLYLNELIQIARDGSPSKRDKALFNAVRIDPTVIGTPTATARISRAVMLNDQNFFEKLRSALSGKLGQREAKNYQMIRYILQVLLETNAPSLSDKQLKYLFVKELNLYSDSQSSSEKNLREFAYNFMKQKPTI